MQRQITNDVETWISYETELPKWKWLNQTFWDSVLDLFFNAVTIALDNSGNILSFKTKCGCHELDNFINSVNGISLCIASNVNWQLIVW